MKEFLSIIKKSSVFGGVNENEIESLLSCLNASIQDYSKNSFILHTGDKVHSLGLLLSGNLLVIREDFWGNRNILTKISIGQTFAESFACAEKLLTVDVFANDDCTVMWLDINKILKTCPSACTHHSQIIRNLLSDLAYKNLIINEKLTHITKRSTKEKLLSYLSFSAKKFGKSEFDIPFDRQQLADYLSVERSAMSAELCKLRDDGIIKFEKNHFKILKNINSDNS